MKFLITPKQGPWVAVQDDISEEELKERILSCDISITDLDDTLAPSPAERLAFDYLGSEKRLDPGFLRWTFITGLKLTSGKLKLRDIGDAKAEQWTNLVEKFVDRQERERLKKQFTPLYAAETLFPGVMEFYKGLMERPVYKLGITRNIEEIAQAYATILELDELFYEAKDKERLVRTIITENPDLQNYLMFDDVYGGKDATGILKALTEAEGARRIKDVVSCQVRTSLRKLDDRFTINIGRDYCGLVDIIGE